MPATAVPSIEPEPLAEDSPTPPEVSRLIGHALRTNGRLSQRDLVRRLGAPLRKDMKPIPNQYSRNQTDTLFTLVYRGLWAQVYDVTGEPKAFLVRLSLLSPTYRSPEGLRVGLAEPAVRDAVGPPVRRNDVEGTWTYRESPSPTSTTLVLRWESGRVAQLTWTFPFT